jgi:hypothetical protein
MGLLLIDTDVFVLLAAAGLIDRVAELLGFESSQVRRLYPVENQLTRGRSFKTRYPEAVRQTALTKAKSVTPLTDRPTNDAMLQKLAVSDIDEGETLMYALMAENPSWLLTTGDRRSLVALATNPDLKDVCSALAGRLICIETVLRLLVVTDGVEKVAAAFAPVRDTNQKLRVIFSEANATNLDSCLEGIDSYLAALRREIGEHLLYGSK